jgi:hypothetical protein
LAILLLLQLLLRWPLLFQGYGNEEDSYGHVLNVLEIRETGTYVVSRLPGHPVYEGLLLLVSFFAMSPLIFNGLSAIFGLLALFFFYKIYTHYQLPWPLLATAVLGLTPVFYISSTYTIDYVVALALVLWSYHLLLQKHFLWAAVVLGLATGIRLTALAMGLPFFLILWDFSLQRQKILQAMGFALVTFGVAAICYLPPYLTLGWSFFDTYALPWPPVPKILYKASIGAFGFLGCLGLMGTFGVSVWERLMGRKVFGTNVPAVHAFAWVVTIVLYTIAYIRVPEKSAFVLPMLPFLLLYAAFWMPRKRLLWMYALLLPAAFVMGVNLTDPARGADCSKVSTTFTVAQQEICIDFLQGPIFHEFSKRQNKAAYTAKLIAASHTLPDSAVVIAGWWQGMVAVTLLQEDLRPDITWAYYLPPTNFQNHLENGRPIFYLAEQAEVNNRKYNNTLATDHAQLWNVAITP